MSVEYTTTTNMSILKYKFDDEDEDDVCNEKLFSKLFSFLVQYSPECQLLFGWTREREGEKENIKGEVRGNKNNWTSDTTEYIFRKLYLEQCK